MGEGYSNEHILSGTAAMSTPRSSIKRLTILRRKPVGEGYSNTEFGAHSYKDILSPSKDVEAQEYNAQYVHMKIDSLPNKKAFHLTMVYAFNGIHERALLWDQLRRIAGLFDHSSCLIGSTQRTQRKRNFKYFNMWGGSKDFKEIVRQVWHQQIRGTPMYSLVNKLKCIKPNLLQLNREGLSDIEQTTGICQKKVESLQRQLGQATTNTALIQHEYEAVLELTSLTMARDNFLLQKAKCLWSKEGDANSAFFHNSIKKRRNQNKVIMIEDMNGMLCDTPDQVKTAFLEYYQHLLGSSQTTKKIHRKIIDQGPKCNEDQYAVLLRPVSREEVKEAIFGIPDIKSPGPDGYTSKFFKDAWGEVGKEVIQAIQDFFTHGKLLKQLNATSLTLIPKCDRPQTVLQFHPITCCNVIYKVISKLLCSRLAEVLPQLVDKNQGAFIQHRSIQENILIYEDLIRLYERPSPSPRCMFKIDLQKAYDTVEWEFVDKLMKMLKFPEGFRSKVMQCITTASFSLSLNGEMFGFFQGKRGLSKGDAASMMLLLKSFSTFSKATGLRVSPAKSSAYFGGVSDQLKQEILQVSGFTEGSLPFRQIGDSSISSENFMWILGFSVCTS
ncbi:uncharacterized protein LOC141595316 [Silene latifolia]|uniref:uncharacterized protein LOC141595316 n=1 Tax=Silene latifolia TaxID=37657 RepID=UPI003D7701D4